MHVEFRRRLTPYSGDSTRSVWDARVTDDRGRVYWACDHGHGTGWAARSCGSRHLLALQARGCPVAS